MYGGVVGGEGVAAGEAEEHVSGNESLEQRPIQADRKQDAVPVIQGEKKPCVSCWSSSHQKSRPGIGSHYGLVGVWDDDAHLKSCLP